MDRPIIISTIVVLVLQDPSTLCSEVDKVWMDLYRGEDWEMPCREEEEFTKTETSFTPVTTCYTGGGVAWRNFPRSHKLLLPL